MIVEKVMIDLKSGERKTFIADLVKEFDCDHRTYSLTYDGFISEWKLEGWK